MLRQSSSDTRDDTAMLPGHVEYCATMQRRCCDDRCSCCAVPLLRRSRCYVTYARRDRLRIVVDAVMIRRRSKDAATTQRRCCNYDTAAAVVLRRCCGDAAAILRRAAMLRRCCGEVSGVLRRCCVHTATMLRPTMLRLDTVVATVLRRCWGKAATIR